LGSLLSVRSADRNNSDDSTAPSENHVQQFAAAFAYRPNPLLAIVLPTVDPHDDPTGKYLGCTFEPDTATPFSCLALCRIPLERHRTVPYALRAVQATGMMLRLLLLDHARPFRT
jgi:hypothetical protein